MIEPGWRVVPLHPPVHSVRVTAEVHVVHGTASVRSAIEQMLGRQYTQLPVVDDEGGVVGVVSVWSLLRGLIRETSSRTFLDAWVEDYLEPAEYVHVGATADHMLERLQADRALLVGTPAAFAGIVTADDVLRHFADLSKPFVILGEIEEAVRALIRCCVPDIELPSALEAALASKKTGLPERLEDCTFEDYRLVLVCRHNRPHFAEVIGPSSGALSARLAAVRDLRNRVMHFKEPIAPDELALLQESRTWLEAKLGRARRGAVAADVA